MENEFKDLEDELGALRPAPLPADLEAKVLQIFDRERSPAAPAEIAQPAEVIPFPLWRRLGAAAAVLVACTGVFFALLNNFGSNTGSSAPGGATLAGSTAPAVPVARTFRPVSAENIFEGIHAGNVFIDDNGEPVRELLYNFSNSFRWENSEDGSVIEMNVPRQRHFLVPVRTD